MIVDCHTHCKGGDLYHREFSAEQIIRCMDEAGVDRSVVFAICAPSLESQAMTQAVCSAAPERLIPFAHVLPDEGPLAAVELDRAVRDLGCRGLKLHVGELPAGVSSDDAIAALEPLVSRCADLSIPCLFDCGARPDLVERLATSQPGCNLLVAHLGASQGEPLMDRAIGLAATHPNVYLDTSDNHAPWKIGEAIERAGANKVVWGSDGPLIHPAIELKKIEVLNLAPDVWERVTCRNILSLIGEDAP